MTDSANEKKQAKTKESKNSIHTWRHLMRFLRGSLYLFMLGILASAIISLADMLAPQVIRMAIDNAIGGLDPDYPTWVMSIVNSLGGFSWLGSHLFIMALILIVIALIRAVSQYAMTVWNNKGSERLVKTMRDRVFHHIELLPYSWHTKNHTGDIIQRCTSDIDKVRNFVAEQLSNIIRIVVLLILSIWFMLTMHVGLTLIAISVICRNLRKEAP